MGLAAKIEDLLERMDHDAVLEKSRSERLARRVEELERSLGERWAQIDQMRAEMAAGLQARWLLVAALERLRSAGLSTEFEGEVQ